MSGNTKKELILCDYCQVAKDGNQIYTNRKQFAGCRIVDILQSVTQRTIPLPTTVKLCSLCASTLHATTGTIARAIELVSKLTQTGKKQNIETVLVEAESDDTDEAKRTKPVTNIDSPAAKERKSKGAATTNGTPIVDLESPKMTPAKEKGTPNKTPATKKGLKELNSSAVGVQQSPRKQALKASLPQTSTPAASAQPSTPKKVEDLLQNAIKLTPAKDVPKKNKDFIQLFGGNADNASDTEEEDEEDDEVTTVGKTEIKNIATGFECKLCDFASVYPNPMKKHLKELHGQKRPRIYNCMKCTKAFGVLNSLKSHLLTHGITEEKDESAAPDPQLAVLTALKPKPKPSNTEYTFAINNTNSSTPKPAGEQVQATTYQCEICHLDFSAVKALQEHIKTVHNIERPKAFKCDACDSHFMHKVTMDRHYKKKHCGEDDTNTALPAKIKGRRKTISIVVNQPPSKEEATPLASSPAKITGRRKTMAVELNETEEPPAKLKRQSPLKEPKKLSELNTEATHKEAIEEPASPSKSKSKVDKLSESSTVDKVAGTPKKPKKPSQVLKDFFAPKLASPAKSKPKANDGLVAPTLSQENEIIEELNNMDLNDIDLLDSFDVDMSSKMTSKKDVDTTKSSSQIIEIDSPSKKVKSSNEVNPLEPVQKKIKSKKDKDTLDSSQIVDSKEKELTNDVDPLDSSQIVSINGTPKKSGKRKAAKQQAEESSQADTADEELASPVQLKPLKKSKSDKQKMPDSDIELLDEINPNVKPHKRTKVDSMALSESELSCSMCSKVVASRKRLDSHMLKKHTTKLTCPNCKVTYNDSLEYVKHFSVCNGVDGLPCGYKNCEKVFAAANFLCSHLNKKHKLAK
ncbi:zinc finger protein CG2199 [Drosophila novamexicana]|uniref:zinc finger protein CG2199 n=1 Tax=Drosophila novamexicana TaxID=47314 RepID=UPI0011E5E497|nr:zinc finger protein CG2199 [Drosophila novamexicana]